MQPIEKRKNVIKETVRKQTVRKDSKSGESTVSSNLSNKSAENEVEIVDKVYQQLSSEKFDSRVTMENGSVASKSWEKHSEGFSVWRGICEASDEGRQFLDDIKKTEESKHSSVKTAVSDEGRPYLDDISATEESDQLPINAPDTANSYLNKYVFPILLPALEQTLLTASEKDCLLVQKCKFNGLDYLAEILWNSNPRYPERAKNWTKIYDTPFAKEWLKEHPRPYYPLSWLLSKEQAAIIIQSAVRGFLVRCQPEVQEMRQFWKALTREKLDTQRRRQEETENWRKQLDQKLEHKAPHGKNIKVLEKVFKEEAEIESHAENTTMKHEKEATEE